MKRTPKSIRIMLSSVGGGKAVYVQADVRCASEIENLMTRTVSEFGRLDIIVNNAGVGTGLNTILEEAEEGYDFWSLAVWCG